LISNNRPSAKDVAYPEQRNPTQVQKSIRAGPLQATRNPLIDAGPKVIEFLQKNLKN